MSSFIALRYINKGNQEIKNGIMLVFELYTNYFTYARS